MKINVKPTLHTEKNKQKQSEEDTRADSLPHLTVAY